MDQAGDRGVGEQSQQATHAEHEREGQQQDKRRGHKQTLRQRWGSTSLANRMLVIFAALSTFGVIAYAFLTYFLWQTTRNAADAAAKSAQAAQDAIHESQRQFDILQSNYTSDLAVRKDQFERTLKQAQDNATQEQGLTRSGLVQSRAALEESRRSLEVSQRARLGVAWYGEFPIAAHSAGTVDIGIVNTGSSSAAVTGVVTGVSTRPVTLPLVDNFEPKVKAVIQHFVISPGARNSHITVKVPAFDDSLVTAFKDGSWHLYVYGRITYDDGFRHIRYLVFCGLHEPDKPTWRVCPNNNAAD